MRYSRKDFNRYKNIQVKIYKEIKSTCGKNQYDEQALPSYTNPNPLMRFLFWERIKVVIDYLSQLNKVNTCLDFGSGMGPAVPYLLENTESLFALDLDTSLLERLGKREGWKRIKYINNLNEIKEYSGKIDLILALDVLEHVDDLPTILSGFSQLLSRDGILVISGPTENFIYKIGRMLAHYSGDYHARNIYDVNIATKNYFEIVFQKTLFKAIPFFEIYSMKKQL